MQQEVWAKLSTKKSIESIAVDQNRVESTEGSKVESIDRVDRQLSWIDRVARLDRFRSLPSTIEQFFHADVPTRNNADFFEVTRSSHVH